MAVSQNRALLSQKPISPRERLIVEARLMAPDEGATLADLGRRLGLTRERVRQLEVRVKTKLRSVLQPIVAEGA